MAFALHAQQSTSSHWNEVMKENGGKTRRQDQESNKKNGISNNSPQTDDRISMVEMVWARKNGGREIPQNSLSS